MRRSSDPQGYQRHWTPVHLDFVVGNIEAAAQRAQAAGATLEGNAQTEEWGRVAIMSDPFGHGFCLLEFSGVESDAAARRKKGQRKGRLARHVTARSR